MQEKNPKRQKINETKSQPTLFNNDWFGTKLPTDINHLILNYFTDTQLIQLSVVNKNWEKIIENEFKKRTQNSINFYYPLMQEVTKWKAFFFTNVNLFHKIAENLIEHFLNVEKTTPDYYTIDIDNILAGQNRLEVLMFLLTHYKKKVSGNKLGERRHNLLHLFATSKTKILDFLITKLGLDIHAKDAFGHTPLVYMMIGICNTHADPFKLIAEHLPYFIKKDVNVNKIFKLIYEEEPLLKFLLDREMDINGEDMDNFKNTYFYKIITTLCLKYTGAEHYTDILAKISYPNEIITMIASGVLCEKLSSPQNKCTI